MEKKIRRVLKALVFGVIYSFSVFGLFCWYLIMSPGILFEADSSLVLTVTDKDIINMLRSISPKVCFVIIFMALAFTVLWTVIEGGKYDTERDEKGIRE